MKYLSWMENEIRVRDNLSVDTLYKRTLKIIFMQIYTPKPIDTSDVALPNNLEELAEKIAENVHEVWSAGRTADGWTYGEQRDDTNKKHPCLVQYSELTEDEKDYDRRTSQETIKLILKLGFKISK